MIHSPRIVFPFFLFFLLANTSFAQTHFTWTPEIKKAYQEATSLRFNAAERRLKSITEDEPNNLLRLHIENYIDFFKIYIKEDRDEFDRLEKNKDRRIELIEDQGDRNSPYYLYLQADIRLQWALARLKFDEYATAFFEINKAFRLLTDNEEKFPDFLPNKKNLGILHAMVGTVPDNYKWAVDWFSSMDGTIEQGRGELEEVIAYAKKNEFIYEEEIYVYYAYLLLHLGNERESAWNVINTAHLDVKNNPIACFIKANVAMRTDRGAEAIAILTNRPTGSEFHPFYYLDYLLGIAKLQRLEEGAYLHLLKYVENFQGRNFIKDAYQKLAWSKLIQGNNSGYRTYMNHCKSKGYAVVGSDRSALNEAKEGIAPSIELLKARLLFDGGYFQKAYAVLKEKNAKDYLSKRNKLEYTYRMGRILQKLKREKEALLYYNKTIANGKNEPWYFACRSALEKGLIYEQKKEATSAKAAFKTCLSISPDDHKTVLHQQAKAGIRRLKN